MLIKDVPSPTLFGLYIDELETYLDEIDKDSLCLCNTMVAILLCAKDVILLIRLGACLQRLVNKPYEFYTVSSLEVNLSKTKIIIFDNNKKKLNPKAFCLDKGPIEITHEYKYVRTKFHSHGYLEPSSKR